MLQVATKIGLYINDRDFERTNSGTPSKSLPMKFDKLAISKPRKCARTIKLHGAGKLSERIHHKCVKKG